MYSLQSKSNDVDDFFGSTPSGCGGDDPFGGGNDAFGGGGFGDDDDIFGPPFPFAWLLFFPTSDQLPLL